MIVADALWGERGGNGHGEVDVYSFFFRDSCWLQRKHVPLWRQNDQSIKT